MTQRDRSILLVGNLVPPSVYGCVSAGLSEHLRERGWHVVTTSWKTSRLGKLLDMMWTTWRERRNYQLAQVDVFSGPAFRWAECVTFLLRILGKPYLLALRGGNLPSFALKHRGRVTRMLQSATIVTAPSSYLIEQLSPYRDDIQLVPNPVDIDQCEFVPRTAPRPRLIYLRAFDEIYNPRLAIHTLRLLSESMPDVQLLMIGRDKGDGSLARTKELARQLGVEQHLEIVLGVPKGEVPLWLHKGDIFLNTTNVDNTPVTVFEAMACGLCVVSTNVGGIPYILDDGTDSLLVPPESPEAMAEAVRRCLGEPGMAIRMSERARQKVEEFDWSAVLLRWEQLYSEILKPSVAPRPVRDPV